MAQTHEPKPVMPIVGYLAAPDARLDEARAAVEALWGPVLDETKPYVWDHTRYYEPELGAPLMRGWWAFERLIDPGELARMKLDSNALEARLARPDGSRTANLDPGYLHPAKLVLASAKDFAHRVFLRDGIYAEVTLRFIKGVWTPSDATFADYKNPELHRWLAGLRGRVLLTGEGAVPTSNRKR